MAALAACVAVTLSGCVAASIVRLSVPGVDESAGLQLRDGVLELPDLKLSVRPMNMVVPVSFWGVLIPLIPLPGYETAAVRSWPFHMHLQFETSSDAFRLDPARVVLELDGTRHTPTRAVVPRRLFEIRGGPDAKQPGFTWHCGYREPDATPVAVNGGSVSVASGRACFALEFPVTKPSPDRRFTVIVEGLERSGAPVAVPPIRFELATRSAIGLVTF